MRPAMQHKHPQPNGVSAPTAAAGQESAASRQSPATRGQPAGASLRQRRNGANPAAGGRRREAGAGKLAALVLLAVVLRVAYCFDARDTPFFDEPAPGTDQATYLDTARGIVAALDFGTTVDANPLYPLAVLPIFYAAGDRDVFLTHLLQGVLFGSATVVLVFLLGRRVAGRPAALVAAFLTAVHPPLVVYDCALLSEAVTNVTALAALLAIVRLRERRTAVASLLTGLTIGLAALSKPTMLILAVPALVAVCHLPAPTWQAGRWSSTGAIQTRVASHPWRTPGRQALRTLSHAALIGAAAALTILPVTLRNWRVTGEFIPIRSNGAQVLLMGNNPTATGLFQYPAGEWAERERQALAAAGTRHRARDAARFRLAVEFIRSQPAHFARLTLRKLWLFLSPTDYGNNLSVTLHRQLTFLGWPVFPTFGWMVGVAALAPVVAWGGARRLGPIYAFLALYTAATVPFVIVSRYRLPFTLCLTILVGVVVVRVWQWVSCGRWRPAAAVCGAVVLVVAALHHDQLYRLAVPLVQPNGFVETVENGTRIRDDWGPLRPLFTRLGPRAQEVEKVLVVPADLLPAERAEVQFAFETAAAGEGVVEVNGRPIEFQLAPWRQGYARIPVPAAWIVPGRNVIRIRARGRAQVGVWVCDRFRFGRSRWRDADGAWHTRYLDDRSHRVRVSDHQVGGEYLVRLLLRRD